MSARAAWAVIGAGYGDEGKGLLVDALARRLGPDGLVVVRSNGGAQAGHSVELADGRRHVFHHVPAGALAGARGHLSRFFVHHPMLLADEVGALRRLGARVELSADPRGFVTTPWDMLVNQLAERARGERRHGSCGYGFGETVGRCEETRFALRLADLRAPDLPARLRAVRDRWAPARLAALGVDPARLAEEDWELLGSDALLRRFLHDCAAAVELLPVLPDAALAANGDRLLFEGAQGLLLDQDHGVFPHVTRSRTGLRNVAATAGEAGVGRVEAVYATRCYLTRHGRGPMADERDLRADFAVVDPTNRPNPWQETLRLGLLDADGLAAAVARDAALGEAGGVAMRRHLAVTCLDQARGPLPFRAGGAERRAAEPAFLAELRTRTAARGLATVRGPSCADADLEELAPTLACAA